MENMSKDQITLIVLFYSLVVLVSCMRPFLNQISAYPWVQDLMVQFQEPVNPKEAAKTLRVKMNSSARVAQKRVVRQKSSAFGSDLGSTPYAKGMQATAEIYRD